MFISSTRAIAALALAITLSGVAIGVRATVNDSSAVVAGDSGPTIISGTQLTSSAQGQ